MSVKSRTFQALVLVTVLICRSSGEVNALDKGKSVSGSEKTPNPAYLKISLNDINENVVLYSPLIMKMAEDKENKKRFPPLMLAAPVDNAFEAKISMNNIFYPKPNSSKSLMHYAARWGDVETIHWLKDKMSVNTRDEDGLTPLHEASEYGEEDAVKLLLENGADVNIMTINGTTPLHLASKTGHSEVAKELIDHGAGVNTENSLGLTALHFAIMNNHTKIALLLINKGADVNAIVKSKPKHSPLQLATIQENISLVIALLNRGANVFYVNFDGKTALHEASRIGSLPIVEKLLDYGADVNEKTSDERDTPLHLSSKHGHLDVVKKLLLNGTDVNERNKDGWTALLYSIENGFPEVAIELISAGAAPNMRLESGFNDTPLQKASIKGYLKVVQQLLMKGASVFSRDSEGLTALQQASKFGHLAIVKELLLQGAEIEADDNSALNFAASFGQVEIVEELISNGADIDFINHNGRSSLHEAIISGQTKIVNLLINKGADINIKTMNDLESTPLLLAITHGKIKISMQLIKRGANISSSNTKGWTALHEASKSGQMSIIRELVTGGADVNQKAAVEEQFAPLHLAAMEGHLGAVKTLLSLGAEVDIQNINGYTPLYESLRLGHSDVAMALLAKGAKNIRDENNDGRTPLHLAAKNGFHNIVSGLLKNGANITIVDFNGWTALHYASEFGDVSSVIELIHAGADVNTSTKEEPHDTPLCLAARNDKLDVVKQLLLANADANAVNDYGRNALHEAVDHDHTSVAKLLMRYVSDMYAKTTDTMKYSAFLLAAIRGNLAVLKELMKYGANVNETNSEGWSALHECAKHGQISLVNELILNGADLTARTNDDHEYTPLHLAAMHGHLDIVRALLSKGVDVNPPGKYGRTPLYEAVDNKFTDVALELIWHGANNTHSSLDLKYSPLQIVTIKDCRKVLQELLKNGANISSTNIYGWTALHEASKFGLVKIVQDLLSFKANIEARNIDKWTPLYLAAKWGQYEVAKILVLHGADTNAQDVDGITPLYEAVEKGDINMALLLIKNGARNIPAKEDLQYSPLQRAAIHGYTEIVHELLLNGADIECSNTDGWRPLHEATKFGHLKIVQELLSRGADVNSETTYPAGLTALQIATDYGHQEIRHELIAHGALDKSNIFADY